MPTTASRWSDCLALVVRASDVLEFEVDAAVIAATTDDLLRVDPGSELLPLLDEKLRRCAVIASFLSFEPVPVA